MYVSVLVRQRNRDYKSLKETDAHSRDESQSVCVWLSDRPLTQCLCSACVYVCVCVRESWTCREGEQLMCLMCVYLSLCVWEFVHICRCWEMFWPLWSFLLTLWKQKDLRFYWNGKWGDSGKWEWLWLLWYKKIDIEPKIMLGI